MATTQTTGFQADFANKSPRQQSIALAKNPGNHPQMKHIELHYHFICLAISDGHILLNYVPTGDMVMDGLIKTLTCDKHELFLGMLGLKSQPNGSVENG